MLCRGQRSAGDKAHDDRHRQTEDGVLVANAAMSSSKYLVSTARVALARSFDVSAEPCDHEAAGVRRNNVTRIATAVSVLTLQ